MKIWCQLPISMPKSMYENYYSLLNQCYEKVKNKDTEIAIKDVPSGLHDPILINYFGLRELNGSEMIKNMLDAEEEGYDAIAGACYFDTGISTVANLLSIPVVGPAKSAMHIASLLGESFAVITTEPSWIAELEHYIGETGFLPRALTPKPVKTLTLPMPKTVEYLMSNNFEPIMEDFYEMAHKSITEGADVIIAGCGLISPIFTVKDIPEIQGVPVIDPMVASLKVAEFMVNLQGIGMHLKTKSGRFCAPSYEQIKEGINKLK